ncbi:MAG: DUF2723 domain-containing protein [Anaerolineae bacterium]|nr:DUF2723 domain-containing protein [Anaerolineae bacterium]
MQHADAPPGRPAQANASVRRERLVAHAAPGCDLGRMDYGLAIALGLVSLAAFGRTLAPDLLYGDSAEFQALAYTLGMTHSTGYPTYLLLARALGTLPLGSPAWRVSLLSAVCAATTVGAVYLLARHLTRSRLGASLGAVALALSHAFWSQAIIAEVYTPAMAFLAVVTLLLWRWAVAPHQRHLALLLAWVLAGLGLGVHASVGLVVPAAAALVASVLRSHRAAGVAPRRCLALAFLGLAAGVGCYLLAFFLMELGDSPTGFSRVVMYPSRSIWGLEASDMDSPIERLLLIALGRQWRGAMFPGGWEFLRGAVGRYAARLPVEFSPATLLCALVGLGTALVTAPTLGGFLPASYVTMLCFILNYEPPDKQLFYLPTYLPLTIAAGAGAGFLLELAHHGLSALGRRAWLALYVLPAALLVVLSVRPFAAARWQALRAGKATFVGESYPYPIHNLAEPRQVAARRLEGLPQGAILVLEWRALYAACYLAHVELGRTDLRFVEAAPYGGPEGLAPTLVAELEEALRAGRAVYVDSVPPNAPEHFIVRRDAGRGLYELSLRGP